jgi:hypothetical protein
MKLDSKIGRFIRKAIFTVAVTASSVGGYSAQAGAFAVDSRNGAWGCSEAREGAPAQQYNLAVNRAVNRGGAVPYIRCAQFTLPRGTMVYCYFGYVPNKGWCGNWATTPSAAIDGLVRQGVRPLSITFANVCLE